MTLPLPLIEMSDETGILLDTDEYDFDIFVDALVIECLRNAANGTYDEMCRRLLFDLEQEWQGRSIRGENICHIRIRDRIEIGR